MKPDFQAVIDASAAVHKRQEQVKEFAAKIAAYTTDIERLRTLRDQWWKTHNEAVTQLAFDSLALEQAMREASCK